MDTVSLFVGVLRRVIADGGDVLLLSAEARRGVKRMIGLISEEDDCERDWDWAAKCVEDCSSRIEIPGSRDRTNGFGYS